MTAKAIGNKIKAKGLQKLKFYCQMCNKQCRDANGFKCHQTSEAHLRQMSLFAEDPEKYMKIFSQEFEDSFMDILKRKRKRAQANHIYQEVVADRHHIHMNATVWLTLANFIQYLGKENKAVVDKDEEGKLWVTYVKRDPELLARQAAMEKRIKDEKDYEEREAARLRKQILKAAQQDTGDTLGASSAPTTVELDAEREKLVVTVKAKPKVKKNAFSTTSALSETDSALSGSSRSLPNPLLSNMDDITPSRKSDSRKGSGKRESNLEQLMHMMEEDKRREKERQAAKRKLEDSGDNSSAIGSNGSTHDDKDSNEVSSSGKTKKKRKRKANWIFPHIVVKILNKKLLQGKLYKKKGVVLSVEDKFTAEVKVIDDGLTLKIDQDELETVIPKPGRLVLIVNGDYRGEEGKIVKIREKDFSVDVELTSGPEQGEVVKKVQYEDVCKIA